MIQCTKCGEIKEESQFEEKRRQCKLCRNKRQVYLRSGKRYEINNALKNARHLDPLRFMLYDAKARARKQGVPFDIRKEDVEMPTHCPVLGIPLVIGCSSIVEGSPTLDKFKPELGYVKGNTYVISFKANTMKQKATTEEVYKLYLWMKQKENSDDSTDAGTGS